VRPLECHRVADLMQIVTPDRRFGRTAAKRRPRMPPPPRGSAAAQHES